MKTPECWTNAWNSYGKPSSDFSGKSQRLKNESIFLVVIIISLIVALTLNQTLIESYENGKTLDEEQEKKLKSKAQGIAWVYFIASMYFVYTAYKDYKEEKSEARFAFIIAAVLLFAASTIRLYNLYFSNATVEGTEDYAL